MHMEIGTDTSIQPPALRHLNSYMYDIGNLRSHHWKHWMDVYENCAFDCKYCVYRSGDKMGKIRSIVPDMEILDEEIAALPNKGIVYLGPKADVYQPQEKRLGITRKVLEVFERRNVPTFIVTRSGLIERDIDILQSMASRGLIEISISIASPSLQPTLEPGTATVEQRLAMISLLRSHGIPVSVHFSPIIPYLDEVEQLKGLMLEMTDRGASCIYACVLGMAERYYEVVKKSLPNDEMRRRIEQVYAAGNRRLDIYSADQRYIVELMRELSDFSAKRSLPFACVHIPEFDTVERTGHIFRHKLPNIGDMVRYFGRMSMREVRFDDVRDYLSGFPAVDEDFLATVLKFWEEGILFKNTHYHLMDRVGGAAYRREDDMDLLVTNMRVESSH
jgi:DNA repair photolyase